MSITPYSLFTAVLWSSAFILLLYFFRKNTRLLALTGVTPLLFLILGTALRCLFPIEFLHFTNVVGLEGLVAGLFRALRAPLGQLPLPSVGGAAAGLGGRLFGPGGTHRLWRLEIPQKAAFL